MIACRSRRAARDLVLCCALIFKFMSSGAPGPVQRMGPTSNKKNPGRLTFRPGVWFVIQANVAADEPPGPLVGKAQQQAGKEQGGRHGSSNLSDERGRVKQESSRTN